MRKLGLMIGAGLLAACSSGDAGEQKAAVAAVPAKLPAGQWEVTATVAGLRSTDKTTPAVKLKEGDTVTATGCVGADGQPPAELFAAKGDQCAAENPYVRNGRMNVQLDCTRTGAGKVMSDVSGKYTADGMTATVTTTSFFSGSGDYELRQEVTGKRVGECAATPADTKTAAKS